MFGEATSLVDRTELTVPAATSRSLFEYGQRDTLGWATRLWVMTFLSSQIVAAGVAPGLKGAFVGAGPVIARAQLLGGYLSQFNALLCLLLLVYLGLLATRVSRTLFLGVGSALLATVPAAVVYHASREVLPSVVGFVSAVVSGCVLLTSSTQSRANSIVRFSAALCALGLLAGSTGYFLMESGLTPVGVRATAGLHTLFAWTALALVFVLYARAHQSIFGASILMLSLLPAAAAHAVSTNQQAPRLLSAFGHTMTALLGDQIEWGNSYGFTLALLLAASSVLSKRATFPLIAGSLIVFCAFSPITPLGSSAVTVAGFLLVVLPDREADSRAVSNS